MLCDLFRKAVTVSLSLFLSLFLSLSVWTSLSMSPSLCLFVSAVMDIGGLEIVVANSAYVSACGSSDASAATAMRDKKYRAKLNLPHIRECEHMKATVDSAFDSMCVRQLIGK